MAALTNTDSRLSGTTEDEFGLGIKLFLGARLAVYVIGIFMILGALLCLVLGDLTSLDELISNATGVSSTYVDNNFTGYQICMYVQAIYTVASAVCVALLYVKRGKLYAYIDLALFVVLAAVVFIMGASDILFNGSAWLVYFILNPIFSFIAFFAGGHFKYMPFK